MKKSKVWNRNRGLNDLTNHPKPVSLRNCDQLVTDQDADCNRSTCDNDDSWTFFESDQDHYKRKFSVVKSTEFCQSTCVDCVTHPYDRPYHCPAYWDDYGFMWPSYLAVLSVINCEPNQSLPSWISKLLLKFRAVLHGV